jgi:hypothetical protein
MAKQTLRVKVMNLQKGLRLVMTTLETNSRQIVNLIKSMASRAQNLGGRNPLGLQVLIVGPGGSGSTTLIDHVSKYFICNDRNDLDGLKHLPSPPPSRLAQKIVFLHGEVQDVKKSLERRHLLHLQILKLRPKLGFWGLFKNWDFESLTRLQMKKFVEESQTETLFIRYDELFESAEKLSNFLGHKDGFVENFPKRIQRTEIQ